MKRRKASDFPPEVLKLFDGYVHGRISRRDFLDGAARFAIGGLTAAAMLESLRPNYAWAQQVAKDDPRIKTEYLTYPSPQGSGTMRGYFARPANAAGKLPGVVVIHENRGLSPYIEDVARRLAVANFLAFAPDASPLSGVIPATKKRAHSSSVSSTPRSAPKTCSPQPSISSRARMHGQDQAVGFASAGPSSTRWPCGSPIRRGGALHGGQPSAADTAKIKAPLLIHYARSTSVSTPAGPPGRPHSGERA
jgi:carboxymethylenebutenolidase